MTKNVKRGGDENTERRTFYIAVDVPKREKLSLRVATVRYGYIVDTQK